MISLLALVCSRQDARSETFIAYSVPAGTVGNQGVDVTLGMDFDIELDIRVTRIGVFDSGSDGLAAPITARLYNRETSEELATVEFTPEDPGELVGGSRFKPFELLLDAGFRGTIAASGYTPDEPNGNFGLGPLSSLVTNDGGCALQFTGSGRYAMDPFSFPGTKDGGPHNRYAAGTFEFEPLDSYASTSGATAYIVLAGTVGTQEDTFNTSLGMDFDVNVPILLTRLGVFDSGQDGLARPLAARIYDRDTAREIVSLEFPTDDPGEILEGSTFKDLDPPRRLPAGFHGVIVGEGYGPGEPNGNGEGQDVPWITDNGGCALSFTGSSRAGLLGSFPSGTDGGPYNRYAAGTFDFEIDSNPPPPPPDTPADLIAVAGDGRIDLSWSPSLGATPAERYKVLRAVGQGAAFVELAEVTTTSLVDQPLVNQTTYCYLVRAVAAGGDESFDSREVCAVPSPPRPPGRFAAYEVPQGTAGTQDFGGALGMDFNVTADIRVFRLGVFDDLSDGLHAAITARLWNRQTQTELATLEFTPEDPGQLLGGSRFKELLESIDLPAGFQGTIVGSGYGPLERNGNGHGNPAELLPWTTDDGGCRLEFVGGGRFGADPALFPTGLDGGPANRYATGTFEFEALGPPIDPTPEPPTGLAITNVDEAGVTVAWSPPTARPCVLSPSGYRVLRATNGSPPTPVGDVVEPRFVDTTAPPSADLCYTALSLVDGGLSSASSLPACVTTGSITAYRVRAGTVGALTDGLPLGMDFDVQRSVRITRLGAFDSGSDGLVSIVTVHLFDRETAEELAVLDFSPSKPGILLEGSRFLDLSPPLELEAGFHGTIVAEGYGVSEPAGAGGPWTTDPGPCSISFVGTGRSTIGGSLLPLANAFGRPDLYAAGTFQFQPVELSAPAGRAIAYEVPQGTLGTQAFGGALGMDFNVNADIRVERLGVFDSGSDGLQVTLAARLYDRGTAREVAKLVFSPADPGELVGGSRFKDLPTPLRLPAGFLGTIVASGYGAAEPNGNGGSGVGGVVWTTSDAGCAISFVGSARAGQLASVFPRDIDDGPANRYAAGTFEFVVEGGPTGVAFHRGDADQNGSLQLTDAVQILGHLFLGTATRVPECFDASDADDNGQLQLTDAVRILGFLFLGGAPMPSPGAPPGSCGPDPTEDTLGCASYGGCR